jgi:hypothetical protein
MLLFLTVELLTAILGKVCIQTWGTPRELHFNRCRTLTEREGDKCRFIYDGKVWDFVASKVSQVELPENTTALAVSLDKILLDTGVAYRRPVDFEISTTPSFSLRPHSSIDRTIDGYYLGRYSKVGYSKREDIVDIGLTTELSYTRTIRLFVITVQGDVWYARGMELEWVRFPQPERVVGYANPRHKLIFMTHGGCPIQVEAGKWQYLELPD